MGFALEHDPDTAQKEVYTEGVTQILHEINTLQELRDIDGNALYYVRDALESAQKIYLLRNTLFTERLLVTDFDKALTDHATIPCFAALGIPPDNCTEEEARVIAEYKKLTSLEFPAHKAALRALQATLPTQTSLEQYNHQQFTPGTDIFCAANSLYNVLVSSGISAACDLYKEAPEIIKKVVTDGHLKIRDGTKAFLRIFGEVMVISGGIVEIIEGILEHNGISIDLVIANSISQPPNAYKYVTPTNKPEQLRRHIQEEEDSGKNSGNRLPQVLVLFGDDPYDMGIDRAIPAQNTLKILLHPIPEEGSVEDAFPGYPEYDIMVHDTEGLERLAKLLDPELAAVLQ